MGSTSHGPPMSLHPTRYTPRTRDPKRLVQGWRKSCDVSFINSASLVGFPSACANSHTLGTSFLEGYWEALTPQRLHCRFLLCHLFPDQCSARFFFVTWGPSCRWRLRSPFFRPTKVRVVGVPVARRQCSKMRLLNCAQLQRRNLLAAVVNLFCRIFSTNSLSWAY